MARQVTPGANVEWQLSDSAFTLDGPHPGAQMTVLVSQNQSGTAKTITLRLYRDGVAVTSDTLGMTADSDDGNNRTLVIPVPPEHRSVTHRYWVTWASTAGTGPMSSASRMAVLRPPLKFAGLHALPRGSYDDSRNDSLSGSGLGPWWINPATPSAPTILSRPNTIGLRLMSSLASRRMVGVRQRAPVGSFTISALLRDPAGGVDIRSGIFVATAGSLGHVCGPFAHDGRPGVLGVGTTSDTGEWSGYDGYLVAIDGPVVSLWQWFRIRWVASTATFYFDTSHGGVTWTSIGSRAAMPVPSEVGFGLYSNGGSVGTSTTLDVAYWGMTTP
jgi:hypothetical protein